MNLLTNKHISIYFKVIFLQNRYSEDKASLAALPVLISDQKSEKARSLYQSVDSHSKTSKKKRLSCQFTAKTARSVTIRWTDHSISTFSTANKVSNSISSEQLLSWFLHSWSESEQNDFLRQIVVKFDERQLYFASCVITQRHYRDFISLLPQNLSLNILNYLSLQDLSRCRQVCKQWRSIINNETELWKPKGSRNIVDDNDNKNSRVDWEKIQKQRLATKRNWIQGTARLFKCPGHTDRVLCICGNATHLATGSLDRTIRIWLLKDGKLYQTLVGHSKGVWSLRFLSVTILISGGYDSTIKIWNINTGICLRTLLSHSGPVWSLATSKFYCLSGSQDRTARLWRLPKCELHATLTGHTSSVFGVDLNQEQNLCATASADKTVRLWSLNTAQCIKILYASTDDYVMSVSLRYGYIAFSYGFHIAVYRINSIDIRATAFQKLIETHEHRGRIESVQLILLNDEESQPALVSAGHDGLVKFWDFNNNASLQTYNTQLHDIVKINCIYVDRTHIVTVGDDALVNILDFTPRTRNN